MVADKLFITESSDDMAAAKRATKDKPTIPTGRFSIKNVGTARLKFGPLPVDGKVDKNSGFKLA